MPLFVESPLQIAGILFSLGALAYLILALRATGRFRERAEPMPGWFPPVSVLKPVHGDEPELYACLRSFCEQDWPEYEVIFGVHSDDDPAIATVHRLMDELPHRDIRLVIDENLSGPNRKAANLANIYRAARYDIIVLSDADVRVDPHCLAAMAAPFVDGKVGAVACIYKGAPVPGAASGFGSLYVNDWFIPSVLVDVDLRGIDFVFGAMSAVRRQALNAIGGFARLSQYLAEDFVMGRLVTEAGWTVELSPYACDMVVAEPDFLSLLKHEIRWQRTERACRKMDHTMSVITFPLPMMILMLLSRPTVIGIGLIGLEVGLRILLHYRIRRSFHIAAPARPLLVPLRDCICFVTWAVALFIGSVKWRDQTFVIAADGTVAAKPQVT